MAKYRTRKEELFSEIFEKYEHEMYRVALYICREDGAAREVTQKSFYHFYLRFDNVNPDHFESYLIRIVKNLSFNWMRDHKRLRDGQILDLTDDIVSTFNVEHHCIREQEKRLANELCDRILERLYAENQDWFELVLEICYLGRSNIEVAAERGVTRYNVGSKLHRAKKWIKKNFQDDYDEYNRMCR